MSYQVEQTVCCGVTMVAMALRQLLCNNVWSFTRENEPFSYLKQSV